MTNFSSASLQSQVQTKGVQAGLCLSLIPLVRVIITGVVVVPVLVVVGAGG